MKVAVFVLLAFCIHSMDALVGPTAVKPTIDPKVAAIVQEILGNVPELKDLKVIQLKDEQIETLLSHALLKLKEHIVSKCPAEDLLVLQINLLRDVPRRLINSEEFRESIETALDVKELALPDKVLYLLPRTVLRFLSRVTYVNIYKNLREVYASRMALRRIVWKFNSAIRQAVYKVATVEEALNRVVSVFINRYSKPRVCKDVQPIRDALLNKIAQLEKGLAEMDVSAKLAPYLKWIVKDEQHRAKVVEIVKNVANQLFGQLKDELQKIKAEIQQNKPEEVAAAIEKRMLGRLFRLVVRIIDGCFPERRLLHVLNPPQEHVAQVIQVLRGFRQSRVRMEVLPHMFEQLRGFLVGLGHSKEIANQVLVALVLRAAGHTEVVFPAILPVVATIAPPVIPVVTTAAPPVIPEVTTAAPPVIPVVTTVEPPVLPAERDFDFFADLLEDEDEN